MQLTKPEPYRPDPGRVLPPEEAAQVAKTITPVHLIKSRTCKREDTNCKWRLGGC
jgi:hypothetical protein